MYYSIEMLKKCNWNLRKYLKEVAIRSYGLCVGLRDDDTDYTEEQLKKYFLELDQKHENKLKEQQKKPDKPSELQMRVEYDKELERVASEITRISGNLRDLQTIFLDVNHALSQVDNKEGIVYKSLSQLRSNINDELESFRSCMKALTCKLTEYSYEKFKEDKLKIYERECERAEEIAKEDEWESHYQCYLDFVEEVNKLNI